jgi:crossover junction endodeoxyribonuclease RuvC
MTSAREPLRVLGIDPGTRHVGWGVIEQLGTKITHIAHGVVDTDTTRSIPARLVEIDDALEQVLLEYRPNVGVVEAIFYAKDPQAAAKLGHGRGVALLRLARAGLPIFEYPPSRVKRAVTGMGMATKEQVARVICSLLGLGSSPRLDASDALANAFAHLAFARFHAAIEASGATLPPTSKRTRARSAAPRPTRPR